MEPSFKKQLWLGRQDGYEDWFTPSDFLHGVKQSRRPPVDGLSRHNRHTKITEVLQSTPCPTLYSLFLHQYPAQTNYVAFVSIFLSIFRSVLNATLSPNALLTACLCIVVLGLTLVRRPQRSQSASKPETKVQSEASNTDDRATQCPLKTLSSQRDHEEKAEPEDPVAGDARHSPRGPLMPSQNSLLRVYEALRRRSPVTSTVLLPPLCLYLLSPLLINLTKATTDDTIWPLAGALFLVSAILGGFEDQREIAVLEDAVDSEHSEQMGPLPAGTRTDLPLQRSTQIGQLPISTRRYTGSAAAKTNTAGKGHVRRMSLAAYQIQYPESTAPFQFQGDKHGVDENVGWHRPTLGTGQSLSIIPEMTGITHAENLQSCLSQTCTLSACTVMASRLRTSTEVFALLVFVGILIGGLIWWGKSSFGYRVKLRIAVTTSATSLMIAYLSLRFKPSSNSNFTALEDLLMSPEGILFIANHALCLIGPCLVRAAWKWRER